MPYPKPNASLESSDKTESETYVFLKNLKCQNFLFLTIFYHFDLTLRSNDKIILTIVFYVTNPIKHVSYDVHVFFYLWLTGDLTLTLTCT